MEEALSSRFALIIPIGGMVGCIWLLVSVLRDMKLPKKEETMKKYTWVKAAGIRALKTLAQTAIATIGTTALLSEVDWFSVLSASVLAAVLSILTSLAGLPEVDQ